MLWRKFCVILNLETGKALPHICGKVFLFRKERDLNMRDRKRNRLFAGAQQIGKALFLPIAVLPFAGIMLGIGSSFTNETTIAAYGLSGILHPGTLLYRLMMLLAEGGSAVFDNLPLIFALATALGLARREKGVAVMSSAIFYIVMLTTIGALLNLDGSVTNGVVAYGVRKGAIAPVLGIQTLQMGVFGGLVAGVSSALLCNRFSETQLPSPLAFFAGTRFVPIACMVCGLEAGGVLYLVWPVLQDGIYALGSLVQSSGYYGTFLYGFIERALLPFGLHHIFYLPFWQTGVGGSAIIDGTMVMGAQNIFFAELASPHTAQFSVEACRFLTGKYPFMMGGLPGAALAMYVTAFPEKRREAGSLLCSVALTSFLTGITEPIEFTFLFLAPGLFALHAVFAGLSFVTCHILRICVGTTFSDGLIDLILYGVLPGQEKSNWLLLLPVIAVYYVLYFVVFRFCILHWKLKTPGRTAENAGQSAVAQKENANRTTAAQRENADRQAVAQKENKGQPDYAHRENEGQPGLKRKKHAERSAWILQGIGGLENLVEADCCATRLRLTVHDGSRVDANGLRAQTGAAGVLVKGSGVQIIYGPAVTLIKSELEEYIEGLRAGEPENEEPEKAPQAGEAEDAKKLSWEPENEEVEKAPQTGEVEDAKKLSREPEKEPQISEAEDAKKLSQEPENEDPEKAPQISEAEDAKKLSQEPGNEEPEKASQMSGIAGDCVLGAPVSGRMLLLCEVPDETFSAELLGEGVAVEPSEGRLYAPADGTIEAVFATGHAVGMRTDAQVKLLLHIGIDTVQLGGKYFVSHVEQGQRVKKGELLITFDPESIRAAGYRCTTPMIVCNTKDCRAVKPLVTGEVQAGQDLLAVKEKK